MAELKDPTTSTLVRGVIPGSPGVSDIAQILRDFAGDPQKADGVARFLGFEPMVKQQRLLVRNDKRFKDPMEGTISQEKRDQAKKSEGILDHQKKEYGVS